MKIEEGINPNCSELVIRLGTTNKDKALEELRSIGIDEYLCKDWYDFSPKKENKWDADCNIRKYTPTSEIPKEALELKEKLDMSDNSEDMKKMEKELIEKYGIHPHNDSIAVMENDRKPDEEYHSHAWLGMYPFEDNSKEIALWFHQHCQRQGFEMLSKISNHFGSEVEAHDGGSIEDYNSWLDGEVEDE